MMALFSETVLERILRQVGDRTDARTAEVFRFCFLNMLKTAIVVIEDDTAFVRTGDIPAMWLRDSAAQLTPYLHFVQEDPELAHTIARVVRRQLKYVLCDPYANAFNRDPDGAGHSADDTEMNPWVWERKYEVDSLCYPIQLAHDLWSLTGRTDHLGDFVAAANVIVDLWRKEQDHENRSPYRFQRQGGAVSDTLGRAGKGSLTTPNGMTWSAFRPSDDACAYGFNVPGNIFAAVELRHIAELARDVFGDTGLAESADELRRELERGIEEYGVVTTEGADSMYAYEVDGTGRHLLIDDANVPSLLSLPLLGWCTADDLIYLATRKFILSEANPFYFSGTAASGQGSPHTPAGSIWPIALAVEGLTATSIAEKLAIVRTLISTDAGTNLMHESFDKDDPSVYTREWFSWANAMFCELVLDVSGLRTHRRLPSSTGTRL